MLILVIIKLVDFIIPVHVHTTVMMVVPSTCTCSRCSFVHVHTTIIMVVPSTCTCSRCSFVHVHTTVMMVVS